jgi:hypothetical protein
MKTVPLYVPNANCVPPKLTSKELIFFQLELRIYIIHFLIFHKHTYWLLANISFYELPENLILLIDEGIFLITCKIIPVRTS